MTGYLNNEEATANTIDRRWLHRRHRLRDDAGRFYVVDRAKS